MNQLLKQFKSPGQAPIDRYQDERSREEELTEQEELTELRA